MNAIIRTHADVEGGIAERLCTSIDAIYACAQTCITCADACLSEKEVNSLKQCIRLDLDCADICLTTGALASRRTGSNEPILRQALELCAAACRACSDECQNMLRSMSTAASAPSSAAIARKPAKQPWTRSDEARFTLLRGAPPRGRPCRPPVGAAQALPDRCRTRGQAG